GHFINDGLFLTAVETQGLLLNNVSSDLAFAPSCQHAYIQRPTVFQILFKTIQAAGPPSALAVFRRLSGGPCSLPHQRSWMACRSRNPDSPPL
ncbi:MAG: hypothetical protein Q7T98_00340, partial [Polaromonas sp.]|nr:hypothetical protein [Polaromonas sp.]